MTKTTIGLSAGVLLTLLLVGYLATVSGGARDGVRSRGAAGPGASLEEHGGGAAAALQSAGAPLEPRLATDARAAVEAPDAGDVAHPAPHAAVAGGRNVEVTGLVTALDEEGQVADSEDGEVRVVVWLDRGRPYDLAVVNGRFSIEVPETALLSVTRLELRGRALHIDPPLERMAVPGDGRLDVRGRWPALATLRVRSSDGGRELGALTVLRAPIRRMDQRQHPGQDWRSLLLLEDVDSPVALPAPTPQELAAGQATYFVRNPDHAWGSIDVDLRVGGERLLVLDPAGGLRIALIGPVPADASLTLRHSESTSPDLVWALKPDEDYLELESLAVGQWDARVVRGSTFTANAEVLAAGSADVRYASFTDMRLELPYDRAGDVSIEGSVRFEDGWSDEPTFTLTLAAAGNFTNDPLQDRVIASSVMGREGARVFTWTASLPSGTYRAELEPFACGKTLEVAPQGNAPFELVVPGRARVRITVLDEVTGGDAGVQRLSWVWVDPGEPRVGRFQSTTRSGEEPFAFDAPAGTIKVHVFENEYLLPYTDLEVKPGNNDFVLKARPASGFVLKLKDGEAVLPLEWNGGVEIRPRAGNGWVMGFDGSGPGARYTLSEPGEYTVRVQDLPGFLPVPDRTVDVALGKFIEVVIELEREL